MLILSPSQFKCRRSTERIVECVSLTKFTNYQKMKNKMLRTKKNFDVPLSLSSPIFTQIFLRLSNPATYQSNPIHQHYIIHSIDELSGKHTGSGYKIKSANDSGSVMVIVRKARRGWALRHRGTKNAPASYAESLGEKMHSELY